jgi:hypothetical protein
MRAATGQVVPELGIRLVDGVWFVSIPSFDGFGPRGDALRAFLVCLRESTDVLRRAPRVIIDLRGNSGGSSTWGEQVAAALWPTGSARVLAELYGQAVDWRASELNARLIRDVATSLGTSGLNELADDRRALASAIEAAVAAGQPYYREHQYVPPDADAADERGWFAGDVFVLTDLDCASACLDFLDIVLRIPGVRHIGLPTSADTQYMDLGRVMLPSRLAELSFGMKAIRGRKRGRNQWYEPVARWRSGAMTDARVSSWVKQLG